MDIRVVRVPTELRVLWTVMDLPSQKQNYDETPI